MPDSRLVDPRPLTAPSTETQRSEPVADDLALEAAHRLRVLCAVLILLWIILLVMNHLVVPNLRLPADQIIPFPPVANFFAVGCIALSAAVFWIAPRAARVPGRLSTVSLVYEVLVAFAVGVINQWEPRALAGRLSWLCVIVLIFPSIVPGPPRKILIGSLIAATMDPVGLAIARARGLELQPLGLLIWTYLPNYICAFLAVIPSRIIVRLSRKVSRARQLGSYRLVELIGRGGMGEVWKAEHQLFARPAAIKLISSHGMIESSGRVAAERFRREAEAAAKLRSPHTIQLYDFGIARDRRLYYVMELLEGSDLESLVARHGPQPPARVAHLLRQACHSLAEAHAAGMVHRDIKPANLHVGRFGLEYDFVKVLDFGLVKHGHTRGQEDVRLTAPESMSGTPAYMAPEMAGGETVDGRADLYALGCVGYFLLTGTLVFDGDNAMQQILKHLQAAPVPPSTRLGRPLPDALERLVLDCLAKSPADRPSGATALAERLTAAGADLWTQGDARLWWEGTFIPAGETRTEAPPTEFLEIAEPHGVSPS